jgi:hypothetical protein
MVAYWWGSFRSAERRLIVIAALVLLPVFFLPVLPIWTMKLWAPQYPEGLTLTIYTNSIRGDLQKINTLNHYVGMHPITAADFREFTYLPQLLTLFGFMALVAALVNRRAIALLGWLAFTGFAVYMFRDYAHWLWHYGHDLDPRAGDQARHVHASPHRLLEDGELQGLEPPRSGHVAPRARVDAWSGGDLARVAGAEARQRADLGRTRRPGPRRVAGVLLGGRGHGPRTAERAE